MTGIIKPRPTNRLVNTARKQCRCHLAKVPLSYCNNIIL